MARRILPGDVFEIPTTAGLGYFQFVLRDPDNDGPWIRILRGVYGQEPDLGELVLERERFWTMFPVGAAAHRKLVRYAGRYPIPIGSAKLPRMRSPLRGGGGRIHTWSVEDGAGGRAMKRSEDLTEEEAAMSWKSMCNDTWLAEHIASGWQPTRDSPG